MVRIRLLPSSDLASMLIPTPVIFATQPDGTTIDRDSQGGNPFATALIELSNRTHRNLGDFAGQLRTLTEFISGGNQSPTWENLPAQSHWNMFSPVCDRNERRVALVLIVSEYPALEQPSLFGAAWDERRISALLGQNGFSVEQGVIGGKASLVAALRMFSTKAKLRDCAIIYATGHGVEVAGETFLLPSDYPFAEGYSKLLLRKHALSVSRIRKACSAKGFNMAFFAGCRSRVGE
jgi:hypothetical protein